MPVALTLTEQMALYFSKGLFKPLQGTPMYESLESAMYTNNGLYLVGHDHREDDLRTFAVERIQSARLTNRRFEIPPDFNFEEFKQTAFNMIWGEPQEVKIRFSPSRAPYIRERTWHASQKIESCDDGCVVLSLYVGDLGEVKRWLTGFGAEAEVSEPRELRQEIVAECKELARGRKERRGLVRAAIGRERDYKRIHEPIRTT